MNKYIVVVKPNFGIGALTALGVYGIWYIGVKLRRIEVANEDLHTDMAALRAELKADKEK